MKRTSRHNIWRKAGIMAALAAALALGLTACYPGGPEDLGELGVVVTFKNPVGDFKNLKTYAMEDVVAELEKPGDDSSEPIDPQFNPTILAALKEQMAAAGFDSVDTDIEKPDVWLSVGAVESEVWVYWYEWGYWGGYPGWGGGYYPPYIGSASFQQGTLIWQLHDLRGVDDPSDPEAAPPINWVGALNGALSSKASTTHSEIRNGIKQAFAQSPYIAAGGTGK